MFLTHNATAFAYTIIEVIDMAKAGMRRPDPKAPHGTQSNHKMHMPKNDVTPVPEIKGKPKRGHEKARPM
jgi:hypothetical protein